MPRGRSHFIRACRVQSVHIDWWGHKKRCSWSHAFHQWEHRILGRALWTHESLPDCLDWARWGPCETGSGTRYHCGYNRNPRTKGTSGYDVGELCQLDGAWFVQKSFWHLRQVCWDQSRGRDGIELVQEEGSFQDLETKKYRHKRGKQIKTVDNQ